MRIEQTDIAAGLAPMQVLATQVWSARARHHPGQLAWSAAYALPEDIDHGPVWLASDDSGVAAWAWLESPDWVEVCARDEQSAGAVLDAMLDAMLDDAVGQLTAMTLECEASVLRALHARGLAEQEGPWFTHHTLDLQQLPDVVLPARYTARAVHPDEHDQRAALHRAAWSPTSKVSGAAYRRLMSTPPYRADLDHVVIAPDGAGAASCCVWLDDATGVALVEPVGCVPEQRRRGLAAASVSALTAARASGASTGLVWPRGDADYPAPARLYRGIGFAPGPRTRTYRRPADSQVRAPGGSH